MPDKNSKPHIKKEHKFFLSIFKGEFSEYLKKKYFEKFLNEMLDYFSENKNNNEFGLIENGTLKEKCFNNLTNILDYLSKGLSETQNLPLDKITMLRNLNSLIRTKSREVNVNNDNEFYKLIFSSINVTHNSIVFAHANTKKTLDNDTIFKYLSSELENFGNLVLELRQKEHEHNKIATRVANLIKNSTKYLNSDQAKKVKFVFINQFHHGIDDIDEACQELFNTTDCYYPESPDDQFHAIRRGRFPLNTENVLEVLNKLLYEPHNSQSNSIFHSDDEILNFLTYFSKRATDKNASNSGISETFVDRLSLWIHTLPNVFENIKPKPEVYNQLFFLVEQILADPHFNSQKFFKATTAINTCIDLMTEQLKQTGVDSTVNSFVSLFERINSKEQISIGNKLEYANELAKLGNMCFQDEVCNYTFVSKKFTDVFGTMARKIPISDNSSRTRLKEIVQLLFKNATRKISENELKEIALTFLNQYHGKNARKIARDCEKLFNLTNCQEFIVTNRTLEMENDTQAAITLNQTTPANVNHNATIEFAGNSNQTSNDPVLPTPLVFPGYHSSETISTTEIISDVMQKVGSQIPSATEISISVAHGFGSGLIIFTTRVVRDWLTRNGKLQSRIADISLHVAEGIVHAFYNASFMLILAELNAHMVEGNETEAQTLWEKMAPMLPSVVINLGMRPALQLLNFLCGKFLPKILILKGIIDSIPTLANIYYFAQNPILFGIQTAVGYTTSVAAFFTSNKCLDARKNRHHSNIEAANGNNEHLEMKKLNYEKDVETFTSDTIAGIKVSEKTYQYITEEKFNEIKNQSEGIIKALEKLINSLKKSVEENRAIIKPDTIPKVAETYQKIINDKSYVLQAIERKVEECKQDISLLQDDHKGAYQKHIIENTHTPKEKKEIKAVYSAAMEKLGNVFKRMEPMFNQLKVTLGAQQGYVEAASESFAGDVTLDSLIDIMKEIEFPLSSTKVYVSSYNTWAAAEKGEKNGVEKTLANHKFFENSTQSTAANALRPKKTRTFLNTRCKSMASDSDTRTLSSGSEGESIISTGSSKDEENAQIVRPLLKSSI